LDREDDRDEEQRPQGGEHQRHVERSTADLLPGFFVGGGGGGTAGAPAVWGPASYNIGAGMARVRPAAEFIRRNMPFDQPGTLTDQQAFNVAAYVNAHPRPDYRGKENDWPNGDPPPDAAYATRAAQQKKPR
jgi:cytochrome c